MSLDVTSLAWHRSIGKLLAQLDSPIFWYSLVHLLKEYTPIDNWVVLIFSKNEVNFVCCRETINEDEKNALINEYINNLYMLDPFYISNRENPKSGLFHLFDIAPVHFFETEYYNSYFKHHVLSDEIQYNVRLDEDRTLCLSLGSQSQFTQGQMALLELIQPWVIELMRLRMKFEVNIEKNTTQHNKWQDKMEQFNTLLTQREMEILKLLFSGFSNRQVAGKLCISVETVKAHRRNFYAKLNIKSQSEFFALFFHEEK
ncbi:helix-turn-helix transcriptional regulator [Pseudomonas protegens]|uniref:Helix-turn-helix transcriptional regulator n=1 Tax=Pseudomonas protegens TaxID=380021 RepID=A0A2T6GBH9_9PSED|nr:helix-turn-helix transcriptional regulator [Pseudomonas protegens]PUA41516.1 helix-turn-helix transcriptional regulator [Pseudomonas protegens]